MHGVQLLCVMSSRARQSLLLVLGLFRGFSLSFSIPQNQHLESEGRRFVCRKTVLKIDRSIDRSIDLDVTGTFLIQLSTFFK